MDFRETSKRFGGELGLQPIIGTDENENPSGFD